MDAYEILGVSGKANIQEITSAYKKLALKHHPDRDPTSAEYFKLINVAHKVLIHYREVHDDENRGWNDALGLLGDEKQEDEVREKWTAIRMEIKERRKNSTPQDYQTEEEGWECNVRKQNLWEIEEKLLKETEEAEIKCCHQGIFVNEDWENLYKRIQLQAEWLFENEMKNQENIEKERVKQMEAQTRERQKETDARRRQNETDARQRQMEADGKQSQTEADAKQSQTEADAKQSQKEAEARERQKEADARERQMEADARERQKDADARERQKDADAKQKQNEADARQRQMEADAKQSQKEAEARERQKEADARERQMEADARERQKNADARQKQNEADAKQKQNEADARQRQKNVEDREMQKVADARERQKEADARERQKEAEARKRQNEAEARKRQKEAKAYEMQNEAESRERQNEAETKERLKEADTRGGQKQAETKDGPKGILEREKYFKKRRIWKLNGESKEDKIKLNQKWNFKRQQKYGGIEIKKEDIRNANEKRKLGIKQLRKTEILKMLKIAKQMQKIAEKEIQEARREKKELRKDKKIAEALAKALKDEMAKVNQEKLLLRLEIENLRDFKKLHLRQHCWDDAENDDIKKGREEFETKWKRYKEKGKGTWKARKRETKGHQKSQNKESNVQKTSTKGCKGKSPTKIESGNKSSEAGKKNTDFICSTCNKLYTNRTSFWRHKKLHEEPKYYCNKCNKGFYRKDNFDRHRH